MARGGDRYRPGGGNNYNNNNNNNNNRSQTICKFWKDGDCHYGDGCRFNHAPDQFNINNRNQSSNHSQYHHRSQGQSQNRYQSLQQVNNANQNQQKRKEDLTVDKESIRIDMTTERPQWPFSCYGTRDAPVQLFGGPLEQSPEEMRVMHYLALASGNVQTSVANEAQLHQQVTQQINQVLQDLDGAERYILNGQKLHPNRLDIIEESMRARPLPPPGNPFNLAPTHAGTSNKPSPFATAVQPSQQQQQSPFRPSPFGTVQPPIGPGHVPMPQKSFGQPSVSTTQSVFGQPPPTTSHGVFGQPSGSTQPGGFGQPSGSIKQGGFGQPSGQTQPGGFGQPSGSTQRGGFGQPSGSILGGGFGQPSASSQPTSFGQPSGLGPASSPWQSAGKPAQTSGFPSAPSALGNLAQASSQSSSPFAVAGQQQAQPAQPALQPTGLTNGFNTNPVQPLKQPPSFGAAGSQERANGDGPKWVEFAQDGKTLLRFKNQRVEYIDALDDDKNPIPGARNPHYLLGVDQNRNPEYQRIWCPLGEPKDAQGAAEYVEPPPEAYTKEHEKAYEWMREKGEFLGGVMPLMPPRREWIRWDI
ncbi:hypothetical protein LTR66_006269 [Elasticomyces elasticus]|nr:hypothetical protein LTR66_006269 [Elasticomyces elasticus]